MVLVEEGRRTRVLPVAELPLRGAHNLENALAACAAAAALSGAAPGVLAGGLRGFPGVEHRLSPAGSIGQVIFVNDSKATNVEAQEKALLSFSEPVVLIAGGRDKNLDFTRLRPLLPGAVKAAVLVGEATAKIESAWRGAADMERADTLDHAVARAYELARPRGVVLLSPGCASFDMFQNFEERGRKFREAVARLAARLAEEAHAQ
jgi:UDP-N-acetylmuramoylalanine--D-glutamate ligase